MKKDFLKSFAAVVGICAGAAAVVSGAVALVAGAAATTSAVAAAGATGALGMAGMLGVVNYVFRPMAEFMIGFITISQALLQRKATARPTKALLPARCSARA